MLQKWLNMISILYILFHPTCFRHTKMFLSTDWKTEGFIKGNQCWMFSGCMELLIEWYSSAKLVNFLNECHRLVVKMDQTRILIWKSLLKQAGNIYKGMVSESSNSFMQVRISTGKEIFFCSEGKSDCWVSWCEV